MLATSLSVAQRLERPTGVRKVMGSIPVGDSDFFFVPRSRQVEYSIFSYSLYLLNLKLFWNYGCLIMTAKCVVTHIFLSKFQSVSAKIYLPPIVPLQNYLCIRNHRP